MIVDIDLEIFNNSDSFYTLDKLTYLFSEGRHQWDIGNPERIKESKWFATEKDSRLGQRVEDIMKMVVSGGYITKPKRRCKRTVRITLTPEEIKNKDNESKPEEFTPENALEYLESPVYVIVENFDSDRTFLEAVITAYKEKKFKDLKVALNERWIKFDGVGGIGEIPKRIDAYYENHQSISPKLYILVDSDRQYPGDEHNAGKVVAKCEEKGINTNHCTILCKRAIENYLPLNALAEVPDKLQDVYEAYKSLDDPNKWDFYNMKEGFGVKGVPEKQKALFDGIEKDDVKALKKGFKMKGFHLYSLFKKEDKITKAALQERCEGYLIITLRLR